MIDRSAWNGTLVGYWWLLEQERTNMTKHKMTPANAHHKDEPPTCPEPSAPQAMPPEMVRNAEPSECAMLCEFAKVALGALLHTPNMQGWSEQDMTLRAKQAWRMAEIMMGERPASS